MFLHYIILEIIEQFLEIIIPSEQDYRNGLYCRWTEDYVSPLVRRLKFLLQNKVFLHLCTRFCIKTQCSRQYSAVGVDIPNSFRKIWRIFHICSCYNMRTIFNLHAADLESQLKFCKDILNCLQSSCVSHKGERGWSHFELHAGKTMRNRAPCQVTVHIFLRTLSSPRTAPAGSKDLFLSSFIPQFKIIKFLNIKHI